MNTTARATFCTSMTGSSMTVPLACGTPRCMRWVISVSALPMSIWPQEGPFGLGEQLADRVGVADIGRDTQSLALQALDLADDGLQRLGPAPGDDDRKSLSRQRQRRGLANAASPAGDKGDFAVRAHVLGLLFGLSSNDTSLGAAASAKSRHRAADSPGGSRHRSRTVWC